MKEKTARIISRVFEPILWVPLVVILSIYKVQATYIEKIYSTAVLLFFVFLFPLVYFLNSIFIKKTMDIDVTLREQRKKILVIFSISFLVGVLYTHFINQKIFLITLAVFFAFLALSIITFFWKISFHSGLNTLLMLLVVHFYGLKFAWLFLFLIPIFYSRLALKKHSIWQLLAGFVVSFAVFSMVVRLGY